MKASQKGFAANPFCVIQYYFLLKKQLRDNACQTEEETHDAPKFDVDVIELRWSRGSL